MAEQEIKAWRYRPLLSRYAVIQRDAVFVPLRRNRVEKEALFVALAIREDGCREILGYWLPGGSELAEEWREILQELHHRGVPEAGFIVAEGLAGLKEIIAEEFVQSRNQRCVVHMMRRSSHKVRAKKYLYALLSEMNDNFLKRRLKNWQFYYNFYQEQKNTTTLHRRIQTQ